MKAFLALIALIWLGLSPVAAQNILCPDRPPSDSSNACANTRFVHNLPITSAATAHLTDCMNTQYGAGNWTKRTGVGTGTDIGPAITACLQALRASAGSGAIFIDPGVWLMSNGIACSDLSGNVVLAYNPIASVVVYNKGSGAAWCWDGTGGHTGGGMHNVATLLESGLGVSNSIAISVTCASSSFCGDQLEFSDLYITAITGSDYWFNTTQVACTARTSPQGCRIAQWANIQSFQASNACAVFTNAIGYSLDNYGCFTGTGGGNDMIINGGGTGTTNTSVFTGVGLNIGGQLNVSNSTNVSLHGFAGSTFFATTATNVQAYIATQTTTGTIGVNSSVLTSGHYSAVLGAGSCGTSPGTPLGGDYDGSVVEGTTATGCTITFNRPFATVPICSIASQGAAPSSLAISSLTTGLITWTHGSASGSTIIWHCTGY